MTTARQRPASVPAPGFSVKLFEEFWRAPDFESTGGVLHPGIRGYWPGRAEPLIGLEDYEAPLRKLLQKVPDFHLEVADHALEGDVTFIRWIAHGTWRGTPLDFGGVDCIRQRDGQVVENRIYCSHPLIAEIVSELGN